MEVQVSVITISRQFGAGGKTLGEMVSKKLNYSFYDREIIQMVAKKARISPQWAESVEKCAGGKLLKLVSTLISRSFIQRILDDKGYIDEEIFIDLLHKIINQIADEVNAVILGRGGQYILRDRENVLHVLLIANVKDRLKFMQERYDLSSEQAAQAVHREDKRRCIFYRKFGKEDYDNPDLYHLALNMSKLKLEKACDLICDLTAS